MQDSHAVERTYRRIQAATGLAFASFLILHLSNLAFALAPGGYDRAQSVFRRFYQTLPIELLLAACLVVHAFVGVRLYLLRRGRDEHPAARVRLTRIGGWFLLLAMPGHIFATRISALFTGNPPGATGVAFTLEFLPWIFGPYYLALGLFGLFHMANGLGTALRFLGPSMRRFLKVGDGVGRWAVWVGVPIIVLGILALRGTFYATPDPFAHPFAESMRSFLVGVLEVPSSRPASQRNPGNAR